MNIRLMGWLALLGGFVWMAFSIKSLHKLPRTAKASADEWIGSPGHDSISRDDAAKAFFIAADEMRENLPHTVAPACLMLGGGILLGAFHRTKNDQPY